MLRRSNPQSNFFDQEIFSRMIPKDHPLVEIKSKVDFSFVTDVVKHLYDPNDGRPSYAPETDIGWDDPVPDDTTLVVFPHASW